jgi:2-oxoglutarate ferredoxin oxidoreductase subunit beta
MLIPLQHGEPIRFGDDGQHGVAVNEFGEPYVCEVADVGEDRLLTHDEHRADPTLAFSLSRLSTGPHMPTPVGIFRDIERPVYEAEVAAQVAAASERQGPGDLDALISSGPTWVVS